MTFLEFVTLNEDGNPEVWLHHWRATLPPWLQGEHYGDCTGRPQTCKLCWLEDMLRQYREQSLPPKP